MPDDRFDILIVGAGPAGIAAACVAAEQGRHVALVDDNPAPGGQIWRAGDNQWIRRLRAAPVTLITGTAVVDSPAPGILLAETHGSPRQLTYQKLILATGARERYLPFPEWTLPGVFGAGGLQALVKSGMPIRGNRVVVAGSGPLLLAVAAFLKQHGAVIPVIAEQAPAKAVYGFLGSLMARPGKLIQAIALKATLAAVPYRTGCWITEARGDDRVTGVTLSGTREIIACDYVACGFGLVPNTELAQLIGCELRDGFVAVDAHQRTSAPDIYCAGEPTGIAGVDAAVLEGQIAAWAAIGDRDSADRLQSSRDTHFAEALNRAFALRPELKDLATPETVVCRCEDVTHAELRAHNSWRAAKLQTRCGMGPCQGRVCGPAVEILFGWRPGSVRPPLFPARTRTLAAPGFPLSAPPPGIRGK